MYIFLFFLLLICPSLFSIQSSSPQEMAALQGEPSALVCDCVNAITGDLLFDQYDLIVEGIEPIPFRRRYISREIENPQLTWEPTIFYVAYASSMGSPGGFPNSLIIPEPSGIFLEYILKGFIKETGTPLYIPNPGQFFRGIASSSYDARGEKYHPINNYALFNDGQIIVHLSHGGIRTYYLIDLSNKKIKSDLYSTTGKFFLFHEKFSDESNIQYNYKKIKDKKYKLKTIQTFNPSGNQEYASLKFKYPKEKGIQLTSSDCKELSYKREKIKLPKHLRTKKKEYGYFLTEAITSEFPKEILGRNKQLQVTQRIFPNKRIVSIEYDNNNRVIRLAGPYGTLCTLTYHNSLTETFDGEGNKTSYYYDSNNLRLIKIEYYQSTTQLLKTETFDWNEQGSLIQKVTFGSSNTPLQTINYTYDDRQNPTSKTLLGKISSSNGEIESYTTHYIYNGRNLIEREYEDNERAIEYTYYKNTNLPASKLFIKNCHIIKRLFYEYNQDNILTTEIIDDGISSDKHNLTQVTERHIKRITPRDANPFYGLPKMIEELYLENGQEKLLKKIILHYNNQGKITIQDIYDATNTKLYSLGTTYDSMGHIISESNALGEITHYTYDENGNKISEKTPTGLEKYFIYDQCNRLIESHEKGDNETHVTKLIYNSTNNPIKTINYLGGAASFTYDSLGNAISSNESNGATTHKTYDCLGNILSITDPRNYTTTTIYNLYGKPLVISYPDGSQEEFTYNLDGTTSSHIDQNGKNTSYFYDDFGNISEEKFFDPSGNYLGQNSYQYNAFHLLSKTNIEGFITQYVYNFAGQLIEESYVDKTIKYTYDSLGRRITETILDYTLEKEYDLIDRVIKEKEYSETNLLTHTETFYEKAGTIKKITQYPNNNPSVASIFFDAFNREIERIDSLGYSTKTEYLTSNILQNTTTDPTGIKVIQTFNNLNQLISFEKRNSQGKTIDFVTYIYDLSGNRTHQNSTIYIDAIASSTHTIEWDYDFLNRVSSVTESGIKTTQYSYTTSGQLAFLKKPDGTTLSYIYDVYDHLASLISSDGSIHYSYNYSKLGYLLSSYDHISRTSTLRTLDPYGNILQETLANDYTLRNTYDSLERRTHLELPKDKHVYFTHAGPFLKNISFDNYSHTYNYDQAGNIIIQTHIDQSISTNIIDPLSRICSYTSPHFTQTITAFDPRGNILSMHYDNLDLNYSYNDHDHLTKEPHHNYNYDSIHNRIQKDQKQYTISNLNQVEDDGFSHFIYDKNGNLISNEDFHYTYDALDRLISVITPQNTVHYTYDSEHRRLTKTINGVTTSFIWDGQHELGTPNCIRILGLTDNAEIGSSIAILKDNSVYLPIHDIQGNLIKLLTSEAKLLENRIFTAFGEGSPSSYIPWGFCSKQYDSETDFIYFGRRYYDPYLGRFITADPEGYTDSSNLYTYVLNNPLNHFDPYGLIMTKYDPKWLEQMKDYEPLNYKEVFSSALLSTKEHTATSLTSMVDSFPITKLLTQESDYFTSRTKDYFNRFKSENITESQKIGSGLGFIGGEAISWLFPIDRLFNCAIAGMGFAGKFTKTFLPEISSLFKTRSISSKIFQNKKAGNVATLTTTVEKKAANAEIWTKGKFEKGTQNAYRHWKDHGKEFPELINAKQYIEFAHNFIKHPPPGTLMKIRKNGQIVLYNPSTNIIGFYEKNKLPKSLYKPNPSRHKKATNLEYFYAQ